MLIRMPAEVGEQLLRARQVLVGLAHAFHEPAVIELPAVVEEPFEEGRLGDLSVLELNPRSRVLHGEQLTQTHPEEFRHVLVERLAYERSHQVEQQDAGCLGHSLSLSVSPVITR